MLDPKAEGVSAYAAESGTRDAEAELAAIEEASTSSTKGTSRRVGALTRFESVQVSARP